MDYIRRKSTTQMALGFVFKILHIKIFKIWLSTSRWEWLKVLFIIYWDIAFCLSANIILSPYFLKYGKYLVVIWQWVLRWCQQIITTKLKIGPLATQSLTTEIRPLSRLDIIVERTNQRSQEFICYMIN